MLMGKIPFFKTVQRVVILEYQKEGNRKKLLVCIREALLKILGKT